MAKRAVVLLVLLAAAFVTMNQAGAQGEMSVTADPGPHAPGAEVEVTVTGATGSFGGVRQCDADFAACTFSDYFAIDDDGSATATIRVRRTLWSLGEIVDCAVSDCVIEASSFDGDNATAVAPIAVDGAVEIPRPTLAVVSPQPLPDRGTADLSGSGFTPYDQFIVVQCSWGSTISCPFVNGYPSSDGVGDIQVTVPVTRVLDGIDCAAAGSNCSLWIFPQGHLDEVTATGISFDGSSPPLAPTLTVTPSTGLLDDQTVTISGADFGADGFLDLLQCVDLDLGDERCNFVGFTTTGTAGTFTTDTMITRRVNVHDCAVSTCRIIAQQYPYPRVATEISFDDSVPSPPVPTATVEPTTELGDREIVTITAADAADGDGLQASLCVPTVGCGASAYTTLTGSTGTLQMALPRFLDSVDYAVDTCTLEVSISTNTDYFSYSFPLSFDPDAPLADGSRIRVIPSAGLWDRQSVEIRGSNLVPGRYLFTQQCADPDGLPGTCAGRSSGEAVDALGDISLQNRIRRTLALPDGPTDCALVNCYLVVSDFEGSVASVPLTFDPDGPLVRSDLPAQLECVSWPTDGWQRGDIPDGVDAAAVALAGDRMVGQFGGDSVVVIHGGELVYENYSDEGGPDTVMPSFSQSKSFASTMIGLLADDGLLELDQSFPFAEWSDPGDPRQAITLRHVLNMDSGLEWVESYTDGSADVIQMVLNPDPSAYVKAKPLEFEPGTHHRYSTGDTQLLGALIGQVAEVNGDTYLDFLHDELFDPLGIDPVEPGIDPAGVWASGYITNTTTRNFAKLGLLYLRNGVWEDEQFLSSDWVEFVRTPSPVSAGYGGQFWLNGDGSFSMIGLYGQETRIVPDLDLIVSSSNGAGTYQMVDLFRDAVPPSCGGEVPSLTDDNATVRALGMVDVDVLANDQVDPVGLAPATLTIADPPAHGSATIVGGEIRYESGMGFTGDDHLTYVVCTSDRGRCLEAAVTIDVTPLTFSFRPPIRDDVNRRRAGQRVKVKFSSDRGAGAIEALRVLPVDCETGVLLGPATAFDAAILSGSSTTRGSFWWDTDDGWTGCHQLEVELVDGTTHAAAFAWR